MNRIHCLNPEGDEVHVIERVPDGSVEAVICDLQEGLYTTITVVTEAGQEIVWPCGDPKFTPDWLKNFAARG